MDGHVFQEKFLKLLLICLGIDLFVWTIVRCRKCCEMELVARPICLRIVASRVILYCLL